MQEMFEVVRKIELLLGLFYLAWVDWKIKLINGKVLLLLVSSGVMTRVFLGNGLSSEQIFSVLVGGVLLVVSLFTKEAIGMGDALVFMMTGIFLDVMENIILLFATLFFAGSYAMGVLVSKKKGKKDNVAMMPFTLAAYVLVIL